MQTGDQPGGQGDDELGGGAVVLFGQVGPLGQHLNGLCPADGLEAGVRVPGAAFGVGGVHGHLAGEQPLLQGRVSLNGHAQLLAGGQELLFDAAGQQTVLFLNHIQLAVLAVAADDVRRYVRSTDGPDLALLFQLHHGFHRLFQRKNAEIRALPVGVQHVEVVGAKPLQALLHVLDDALGGQVAVDRGAVHDFVEHRRLMPPLQPALGGEHHLVPVDMLERLAHDLLAVIQAVDGGRVDPADALLHGGLDGLDRQGVVVVAPPAPAADGPCPHAEEGHFDAALSDADILHSIVLHARSVPHLGAESFRFRHSLLYFCFLFKKEPPCKARPAQQLF